MLHGAGIFTYIYPKNHQNIGKYTSTMEHLAVYIVNRFHLPTYGTYFTMVR